MAILRIDGIKFLRSGMSATKIPSRKTPKLAEIDQDWFENNVWVLVLKLYHCKKSISRRLTLARVRYQIPMQKNGISSHLSRIFGRH